MAVGGYRFLATDLLEWARRLGQGALLMHSPAAIESPFFLLAPDWALLPLVILSTIATVIASQAVISGAYSLTSQAIQLGYVPRMKILHTSDLAIGQIYVPVVNWMLLFIILCIVVAFKSSDNLAAAYGIAVTATMVITTILACVVMVNVWKWNKLAVALIIGLLVAMLQAVTQINEATLVFIPKLFGIGAAMLLLGVSMFASLADFTRHLIDQMVALGGS